MFHYDSKSQKCVKFIYGGCYGTENLFGHLTECVTTCKAKNVVAIPGETI